MNNNIENKKLKFDLNEAINIQMGNYPTPKVSLLKVEELHEDGTTTDITDQYKAKLFVEENLSVIKNDNAFSDQKFYLDELE